MGYAYPGGLHRGGDGGAHLGLEGTRGVDRRRGREERRVVNPLATVMKMTDVGKERAGPGGRRKGRGRQKGREEKEAAHGRGMACRAPPTWSVYSLTDSFACPSMHHILNPYSMPDSVLGTRGAVVNNADRAPVLAEMMSTRRLTLQTETKV